MYEEVLAAAAALPVLQVDPGAELITQDAVPGRLLVLEAGTAQVTRDGVVVDTVDFPGAVFGEMSALLGSAATGTVRALTPCTLRVADDPAAFLRASPEITVAVATLLARRVEALMRYLVDVREQYADRDDHLGVVDTVLASLASRQGPPAEGGSDREDEAPY